MNICLKKSALFLVIFSALFLGACSDNPKKKSNKSLFESGYGEGDGSQVEVIGAGGQGNIDGYNVGLNEDGSIGIDPSELGADLEPIIYFEFDSYIINDKGLSIIKHYAEILEENEDEAIVLLGHTDERGSPEYNLALGEKRAKAAKESFMLYGIEDKRIEVITLGESQPMIEGSNEMAWSQNRRVEIKIK